MKYKMIKLRFLTSVHFGDGGLTKTAETFRADTLFSALCQEAIRQGTKSLEKLIAAVNERHLRFSEGLPYIADSFYVPRPMAEILVEQSADSGIRKALKKMKYLPIDKLDAYDRGELDISAEEQEFHENFGKSSLMEKVMICRGEDPMPCAVELFTYMQGSGLYVLIGYSDERDAQLAFELFTSLGYEGIGGKRSSGYGRFEAEVCELPKAFTGRLNYEAYQAFMTLAGTLPDDEEMDTVFESGAYLLERRGGFVSSTTYAPEFRKKKPFYLCKSGAVFPMRFEGRLADVSDGGTHPVYCYAKPFWLGVSK